MVGIKSINGLRIESVCCSNPPKTSTENTAIFINVIHGVLRTAYFLFPFFELRSPVFYMTSAGFFYLKIRDLFIFYFYLTAFPTVLGAGVGAGEMEWGWGENKPQILITTSLEIRHLKIYVQGILFTQDIAQE